MFKEIKGAKEIRVFQLKELAEVIKGILRYKTHSLGLGDTTVIPRKSGRAALPQRPLFM